MFCKKPLKPSFLHQFLCPAPKQISGYVYVCKIDVITQAWPGFSIDLKRRDFQAEKFGRQCTKSRSLQENLSKNLIQNT